MYTFIFCKNTQIIQLYLNLLGKTPKVSVINETLVFVKRNFKHTQNFQYISRIKSKLPLKKIMGRSKMRNNKALMA